MTLLFYWKWVRLCQKGGCHFLLWSHHTQSVPWVAFTDKVLVLAELNWYVESCCTCESALFVLQLLGAAFLGIGLWAWKEKVRTYKHRHADRHSWRASPLQQHSLNFSPAFWLELHRALPSRKESGLNRIWGEAYPLLQYFPENKTCCHSCDLNDLYKCRSTSKFQFHIWSHIWKAECCLYFKSTYKLVLFSVPAPKVRCFE